MYDIPKYPIAFITQKAYPWWFNTKLKQNTWNCDTTYAYLWIRPKQFKLFFLQSPEYIKSTQA